MVLKDVKVFDTRRRNEVRPDVAADRMVNRSWKVHRAHLRARENIEDAVRRIANRAPNQTSVLRSLITSGNADLTAVSNS